VYALPCDTVITEIHVVEEEEELIFSKNTTRTALIGPYTSAKVAAPSKLFTPDKTHQYRSIVHTVFYCQNKNFDTLVNVCANTAGYQES